MALVTKLPTSERSRLATARLAAAPAPASIAAPMRLEHTTVYRLCEPPGPAEPRICARPCLKRRVDASFCVPTVSAAAYGVVPPVRPRDPIPGRCRKQFGSSSRTGSVALRVSRSLSLSPNFSFPRPSLTCVNRGAVLADRRRSVRPRCARPLTAASVSSSRRTPCRTPTLPPAPRPASLRQ